MCLQNQFNASVRWYTECSTRLTGLTLPDNSAKNVTAACLFHLALEHYNSILILTGKNPPHHYGSALTLVRPQFECFIRAIWIHRCASEQEIDRFTNKDKIPNHIDELLKRIKTIPGFKDGWLSAVKKEAWGMMCGLTHGGAVQVANRRSDNVITNIYSDEHAIKMLHCAHSITLGVVTCFAILLGNDALARELETVYQEIFPQEAP